MERQFGPSTLGAYRCDDYLVSPWARDGLWDSTAHLMFVLPLSDVFERPDASLLVVARPGVDGIEFGYRLGHSGVWSFSPLSGDFKYVADSAEALVRAWYAGELTV